MNAFRQLLMVSALAIFVASSSVQNSAEGALFRKVLPASTSKTTKCRPTGGLFESRPVSPTSSWSHQHPKWRSDRKASGAAFRP